MKELVYSSSGQILSLGMKCIGLFDGIPITENLEYEDFIVDNYISALKNKTHGLPSLLYDNNIVSEISTHSTSLLMLVRGQSTTQNETW